MRYRVAIGPSSFAATEKRPLEILEQAGIDVVANPFGRRLTETEIMAHLQGINGLIAGLEPLSSRVLSSFPQLRAIARVGIGMNNVDLEAAKKMNIKVSNTPDEPARAVAEMTLTTLLALCRGLVPANTAMHAGNWQKAVGTGLKGTRVLLVGYGRIGRRVGELLHNFGAIVLVSDPLLSDGHFKNGERLVSLDEGLSEASVVSLHASGTDVIIGENEFRKMRDEVIILNAARGELVDEDALVRALETGKVKSAWFDVFPKEPYVGRLCEFEQVLLTPHISTYTRQCRLNMEMAAVKNLLRDLEITV